MSNNRVTLQKDPETNEYIRITREDGSLGRIMVTSEQRVWNNGIPRKSKRVAFINAHPDELNDILKEDVVNGQMVGKIIRIKSYEPQWATQPQAINPQTQELFFENGKPVYYQDIFTPDLTAHDKTIEEVVIKPVQNGMENATPANAVANTTTNS